MMQVFPSSQVQQRVCEASSPGEQGNGRLKGLFATKARQNRDISKDLVLVLRRLALLNSVDAAGDE